MATHTDLHDKDKFCYPPGKVKIQVLWGAHFHPMCQEDAILFRRIQVPSVYAFFRCIFMCAHYYVTFRLLNVEILQVFRAAYCPSCFSCIFCIVAYPGNLPWLCDALQEQSRFSSEAGTGYPATVSSTTVSFCRARLTRPWRGSLAVFPWVLFFIGPQRGTAGVSVWVLILGLPSVPALWVWTHLDTERRIGLGSSP